MRVATTVLVLAMAFPAAAADLVDRSRRIVEDLFPLPTNNSVVTVETEAVPKTMEPMRTTVVARTGPSYRPGTTLLRVYLDFAAGRLVFLSASGPALAGKQGGLGAIIAVLERESGGKAQNCLPLPADHRCWFARPEVPPYISGHASVVFNDSGAPVLFGVPLPVPESRIPDRRAN